MMTEFERVRTQSGLAIALMIVAFFGSIGGKGLAAHPDSVVMPVAPGTMDACELHCWTGSCESDEHDAFNSLLEEDWDAIRNGGAHNGPPLCRTGTCDTKHGPLPCDPIITLPEGPVHVLDALRGAILSGDIRRIARIAETAPDRVLVNVDRSAVQVTGCRGGIVAHMPVASELLDKIESAVATSQ